MKQIVIVLFGAFFLANHVSYGQTDSIHYKLSLMKVEPPLGYVLDSICMEQRKCPNSNKIVFTIGQVQDQVYMISYGDSYDYMENVMGYFYYQNRLFFVDNNFTLNKLLITTNEFKVFSHTIYKGGITVIKEPKIAWYYKYINGNLIFEFMYDMDCHKGLAMDD